jgi:hypothetical protein
MTEIARITSAEAVIHGVLKIRWDDGYSGVVDLRPVIARGGVFAYLQDPERFRTVEVAEFGHALVWTTETGDAIDFGADSLRRRAELQAELHLRAG